MAGKATVKAVKDSAAQVGAKADATRKANAAAAADQLRREAEANELPEAGKAQPGR